MTVTVTVTVCKPIHTQSFFGEAYLYLAVLYTYYAVTSWSVFYREEGFPAIPSAYSACPKTCKWFVGRNANPKNRLGEGME